MGRSYHSLSFDVFEGEHQAGGALWTNRAVGAENPVAARTAYMWMAHRSFYGLIATLRLHSRCGVTKNAFSGINGPPNGKIYGQ